MAIFGDFFASVEISYDMPLTIGPISAASGLKFTILWGNLEEILLLNKLFSDCRYVP